MEYMDRTEVPTPRLNVVTKISKWDEYEFIEINKMKFIRGYSSKSFNGSELFEYKTLNTPDILFRFLTLHQNLKVKFHHMQKDISDELSDYDIQNILKFCKSYGLPFWGTNSTTNFCINQESNETGDIAFNTIMRTVIPYANENFFHIASFIQCLHWLKSDFLRIVAANNWEDDINIFPLLKENDRQLIDNIRTRQSKHNEVGLYMPNLNPYVTYWDDKNMCLALNCENIVHLATYQLCLLQQAQDYTGGYIKKCPKCNQLFVAAKPQQKYCNNPCTRQAHYSLKKRAKEKGVGKNEIT